MEDAPLDPLAPGEPGPYDIVNPEGDQPHPDTALIYLRVSRLQNLDHEITNNDACDVQ